MASSRKAVQAQTREQMAKRIVLFGGSFDPVHHGHLIVARAIAERQGFKRITFVPTGAPPHKPPPVAPGELRLEMLRAAVAGNPLFDVCDLEVRRAGPTYTIDTLEELRRIRGRGTARVEEKRRDAASTARKRLEAVSTTAKRPEAASTAELFWISGADMLEDLHLWRRAGEVVDAARILIALRPPWDQRIAGLLDGLKRHFAAEQAKRLAEGVMRTPLVDIASSDIRRRVADGLPIDYLVPEGVLEVIRRERIYGKHLS